MRVLILADESRSRRSLAHLFTELGHTVATVAAAEAPRRLRNERFDLIVAEVRTPRKEAMNHLRTTRRQRPETPMVVLSGSARVQESLQELGVAPVTHLNPPLGKGEALAVLRRVEGELPAQRAEVSDTELLEPRHARSELHPSAGAGTAPHELGEGRLELGPPEGPVQKVLRIDATGAPPNLLARLLVGSYITGQDRALITARHGLTDAQRREIHHIVDRTLGMSVVGDSPEIVEVQNFIDPGKHELPRLVHRVTQMLRTELDVCRTALLGKGTPPLELIETIEEEVDRLYLLIVRQLLLSTDNPRMARSIDVESPHFRMGYRVVARALEMTGDLIQGIGIELQRNLTGLRRLPRPMVHALISRIERFDHLLTQTMDALDRLSVIDANSILNVIGEVLPQDAVFYQRIFRSIPNSRVAVSAQRIAFHLDMALEMLIILNEVTINRGVEPETVARTGTRVSTVPPPAPTAKVAVQRTHRTTS